MIDVVNYTCATCGELVDVEGITNPVIRRRCSHSDAVVYANLKGAMVGMAATEGVAKMLRLDEIPEKHRDAFDHGPMAERAYIRGGERLWAYSDWMKYISAWHKAQIEVDRARVAARL